MIKGIFPPFRITDLPVVVSARLSIVDAARFDVKDYGAVGDGKSRPLKDKYITLEQAQAVFPNVKIENLDIELDWCACQSALFAARDRIRATVGGNAVAIFRTSLSYSPIVYFPPGHFIINKPLMVYPHVSLEGCDWGHSIIRLADLGWNSAAQPMKTNPQGIMFVGPTGKSSALFWLEADKEWPVGSNQKVAGMVNSIYRLGLKCHNGAGIYNEGNQNQLEISSCWFNGWGNGPTGLGFISNNATSSTQITNFFLHDCFFEGLVAAAVIDRIIPGSFCNNQIDSCGNGIYIGSADCGIINHNILNCDIPNKPFKNGIWVGLGWPCSISNNIIKDVEESGIKVLGKSIINNNFITMKHGNNIKKNGYGILVVTPRNQFGGDVSILGGKNGPHSITNNVIDADVFPANLKAIFLDVIQGELFKVQIENNLDS